MVCQYSRQTIVRLFPIRLEIPAGMPEKFPVQEQVDDEQCGKGKARIIMHRDPLAAGDAKIQ